MSEWIRKINWKYVVVMLIGNIILGLGIAIFKLSGLGNDPFSGMVMALAECVGIEYARFLILLNLGFFVIEIIWGRKLIGLGTIINALFLGYFVTFFYNLITSVIDAPDQMAMQVVTVFIGVIITSLGISMYQLPKQGVAPYDSISLIMTEKWPKIPYFWRRDSPAPHGSGSSRTPALYKWGPASAAGPRPPDRLHWRPHRRFPLRSGR